ncbi:MAG TPA: DNA-processing protein DprA [Clostridia bacterium]|nr:DNA-processing protein DprA [Clostridia bacterium]
MTNESKAVYILLHTQGIGKCKCKKILDSIKNISTILENVTSLRLQLMQVLSEKEYLSLCESITSIDFAPIEAQLERYDVKVLTVLDDYYPKSMYKVEEMPLLLYCRGDLSLLHEECFAVVGTRYPTRYGIRVTEEFVEKLSERFCIVSGLARGVDAIAHRKALESRGKTIGVLGCGVDMVYPSENTDLYREIIKFGLIISEYDMGTVANSYNFPARNRIVSGLSRGVLVTEAGVKSGTMITINCAEEQGVAVFCVPGGIYNNASGGCNRSIRACQSRIALDVNDIYEELGLQKVDTQKPSNIQLDVNEDRIINELTKNGEMHFEELMQIVDLTVPQLNSMLTKLDAVGLINKTKFNNWSV